MISSDIYRVNMPITRDQLVKGAILFKWHDTGCFGWTPYYCRVDRVTNKFVVITGENGDSKRKSIEWAIRELSTPNSPNNVNEKNILDYGFQVGDTVCHIKDNDMKGIVTEIDTNNDCGGVTTCLVVWGANSFDDAMLTPRDNHDIQWTNKLIPFKS